MKKQEKPHYMNDDLCSLTLNSFTNTVYVKFLKDLFFTT